MMKWPVLVIVADGGGARFFVRERANAALVERHDLAMHAAPAAPPRDRPARVHDRMGPARHNIEPRQFPRAAATAKFLEAVADAVNAAAGASAFKSLVLCAPPRPLGVLRAHLSDLSRQRLATVLAKDYLRATAAQLDASLRAV
jgi:protein required for attachment to host cells